MKIEEYWMDLSNIPPDMEEWLLQQGAKVHEARGLPVYIGAGKRLREVDVYFGDRKIHYYAGSGQARIFFNKETKGAGLFLIVKWPDFVIRHNFPHYELNI